MKNLKKVLAMVLAFACTFTMFAGAKVFEDVPAGSDYSEAITMLSDLGIIQGKDDGKYHPEDTITRAEACALIARMMTGDPNVSQYVGAQNFSDVVSGSWKDSAIGYCYINNIVIGVGNNKFEPDRAITDAEFITMVVRAMGYETPDMVQGYPYTYMSNAQAIGLMDGVDMVANTDALRGEDAQVIYNALFADYARGAKLVNTTHGTSVEQYPTLAESVWGLERAAVGVWRRSTTDDQVMELTTCQAHTWVITGKRLTVGNVDMFEAYPIDDDATELYEDGQKNHQNVPYYFTYNGDMANIADLKGYQVELWGMGAHDEPELEEVTDIDGNDEEGYVYSNEWDVNAIKTVNGQTAYNYTPADDALPDVDLDEVRGFVGGTIDSDINWGDDHMAESEVEDALETKNSASYRVVDWDSDGTADFITGDIYKYYEVKSVTSKTVRLGGFDGRTEFVLDLDGETTGVDIGDGNDDVYTIVAEFPDDIAEGDIIQVSSDEVVGKKEITSTWTVEIVEPETKEITSISSKKGVEFDNELIHDAEFYDENQYYFEEGEGNNPDGLDVYNDLNEDSADLWDLYLDNNGFIIKMDEAEAAYNGYIFVTGADQGNNTSTGNRRNAMISGVNGENEYMEDLELTRNANVEVWSTTEGDYIDGYDDREFVTWVDANNNGQYNDGVDEDINVKGRVFKYTLNDDGDVTRLIEVACENASADYDYNDDSTAVTTVRDAGLEANGMNYGEAGARNWLQTADVIFAVDVEDDEWLNVNGTENIVAGSQLGGGWGDDNSFWDVDMDADNVIAIDYTDIPDIHRANGASPAARGIKYNVDNAKDEIESAVLGVDDLNDFKSTSTKVALLTSMDYNMKGDKAETYDITAYVNGEEETEFNTIDVDDMTVNGTNKDTESIIDRIHDEVEGDKNGVYAELRFNKDGKVTELNVIDDTEAYSNTAAQPQIDANSVPVYNTASVDNHYSVVRAVVNLRNDGDYLMVTPTSIVRDEDGNWKLTTVDNAEFENFYELDGDTAYYKLSDGPMIENHNGEFMNAYEHAFSDDLSVDTGDKADLVSWINSINDEYEDSYCVADVVIDDTTPADGDSVVAVYYYEDQVDEYNELLGEMTLYSGKESQEDELTVKYGADVSAKATAEDHFDEYGNRVKFEVRDAQNNVVFESNSVVDTEAVSLTMQDGTDLPVGTYYVTAYGFNVAADKFQFLDTDRLIVQKAARATNVYTAMNIAGDKEKDSYTAGEDVVFVVVDGQKDAAEPTFTVLNNRRDVEYRIVEARELEDDKVCYELKLADALEIAENGKPGDLVVELDAAPNYSKVTNEEDDVTVVAASAEVEITKVEVTGEKTVKITTSEPLNLDNTTAKISFGNDNGNVATTGDSNGGSCTIVKSGNPFDNEYTITVTGRDTWDHQTNSGKVIVELTIGSNVVESEPTANK